MLVLADAKLRVGAVVMDEPREQDRNLRLPAPEGRRRQRSFEDVLVSGDETLRQIEARLPDPLRHLRLRFEALDVLLEQLAAIGAERRIDVLQCMGAGEVDWTPRLPHPLERPEHELLARDDIE